MNNQFKLLTLILVFILQPFVDSKSVHLLRNKRTSSDTNNLILISFDGFRWDYLENVTLPNMNEYFVNDGVKVNKGLFNVFPTVTYPNHWTLATGLYPQYHGNSQTELNYLISCYLLYMSKKGMVANIMYDPDLNETFYAYSSGENETKWYGQNNQTIPIWILNQLEGGKSAIIGRNLFFFNFEPTNNMKNLFSNNKIFRVPLSRFIIKQLIISLITITKWIGMLKWTN
jgi:hypothetical protein